MLKTCTSVRIGVQISRTRVNARWVCWTTRNFSTGKVEAREPRANWLARKAVLKSYEFSSGKKSYLNEKGGKKSKKPLSISPRSVHRNMHI